MHGSYLVKPLESIKNLFEEPDSIILTKMFFVMNIFLHVQPIAIFHDYEYAQDRLEYAIALHNILIVAILQYRDLSFYQLH